jgi:hypothetical protein
MSMPRFTAENSVYRALPKHSASTEQRTSAGMQVTPALMSLGLGVSCSGGGMDCYCDGGCIRKVGGWCCCSGDKNCPPKKAYFGYDAGAGFID